MAAAGGLPLSTLGLTVDSLNSLIAAYCPTFYLHFREQYRPCTVDWYLARSYLIRMRNDKPEGPILIPEGQINPLNLPDLERSLNADPAAAALPLTLWMQPQYWAGQPPEQLNDVPVYAHVKVILGRRTNQPEALEINYMTLYAYNGAYKLFGLPCIRVGDHVGDIEHVTVRLSLFQEFVTPVPSTTSPQPSASAYTAQLAGVWFNSHRNVEGEWRAAAEVPLDPVTGRIAAYVAENAHGHYPMVGTVLRLFGAANDHTSDQGLIWRPSKVVHLTGQPSGTNLPVVLSRGANLPTPVSDPITGPNSRRAASPLYTPPPPLLPPMTALGGMEQLSLMAAPRSMQPPPPWRPGTDIRVHAYVMQQGVYVPQQAQADVRGLAVCEGATAHLSAVDLAAASSPVGGSPALIPPSATQPMGVGTQPGSSVTYLGGQFVQGQQTVSAATASPHAATNPVTPPWTAEIQAGVPPAQAHAAGLPAPGGVVMPPMPSVASARASDGAITTYAGAAAAGLPPVRTAGFPPVVVEADARPWQVYTGFWGTAEAFAQQGWFSNPEPPVSRTFLQRWCCPCAPGVESVPNP